jgi:flagellar biosynthesis GTPase FlhF
MTSVKNNKYKWEQHMLYASESNDLASSEKEWVFFANSYVPDGEDNCLCSARIKNKYKIVNAKNGNIAFVGRSCLRKIVPPRTKIGSSRCHALFTGPPVEYDDLDIEAYLIHCASVCGALDLQMAQEKLELQRQEQQRREQQEIERKEQQRQEQQEIDRKELERKELQRQKQQEIDRKEIERKELEIKEQQRRAQRLEQWAQQEKLKCERKEKLEFERKEHTRECKERKEDQINSLSYKEWALVLAKRKNTTYEIEKQKIDLLFS